MSRRTTLGGLSQNSMNVRAGMASASRQSLGVSKSGRASIATATFSNRSRVSNAGRKSSAGMNRYVITKIRVCVYLFSSSSSSFPCCPCKWPHLLLFCCCCFYYRIIILVDEALQLRRTLLAMTLGTSRTNDMYPLMCAL